MKRWRVVVGGVSMNLALGSLYAWSVFVLPLEKEFGWKRAETSWVFTIAIVCFALSFVIAGKIQDIKGPRVCAGHPVIADFFFHGRSSWDGTQWMRHPVKSSMFRHGFPPPLSHTQPICTGSESGVTCCTANVGSAPKAWV